MAPNAFSHPLFPFTMFTYPKSGRLLVCIIGLFMSMTACQDEISAPVPTVSLTTTTLGAVLTGATGRSLYFFASDVNGQANCTGNCLNTWPVFYQETPRLGTGLTAREFGTITRPDGTKQTTYNGWPLHYFRNDTNPGDVKGENIANMWYVAKTDYTVMLASGQLVGNDGKSYTAAYVEGTGATPYFVDSEGRTFYRFSNDKKNKNNFTRADFSNNATWPIVGVTAINSLPSVLNRADFSTTDVFGRTQLTYKGNPLYYFGADGGVRGSTKGVSVNRPGFWPVINAGTAEAAQ